jgi:hypothetical protein
MDMQIFAGQVNHILCQCVMRGQGCLKNTPNLLKDVIVQGLWREFVAEASGRLVRFATFRKFVEAKLPDGLEATYDDLMRLCAADPEALELLSQAWATPNPERPV